MKKLLTIILLTTVVAGMPLIAAAGMTFNFPPMGSSMVLPPPDFPPAPPPPEVFCTGSPTISNVEITPEDIWAPAEEDVTLEISGVASAAPNCEISSVSFTMSSDNGLVPGVVTLNPEGNFQGAVTVNLSKNAKLQEGTVYGGTITAVDFAGHKSDVKFNVTVMHDSGNDSGQITTLNKGKKVGLNK